jgi:hypothetical protein
LDVNFRVCLEDVLTLIHHSLEAKGVSVNS